MDKLETVKQLKLHAADAAVHLSSAVDCWVDLLVHAKIADEATIRHRLEGDAAAMADVLVYADKLGLAHGALSCFAIATFLKRELIYLAESSPEHLLGGKQKGKL